MRSRLTRRSVLLAVLALPFTARSAPKIVFLSSELQPLRVDSIGRASLLQRGWAVAESAVLPHGLHARAQALLLSDRQERDE